MACFTVPLAEALILTCAKGIALNKKRTETVLSQNPEKGQKMISIRKSLGILQNMLYGGSFLLAVEHIVHGEITFLPPFLTALKDPADTAAMLHELATSGVAMALLVTAAWGIGMGIWSLVKKIGKNKPARVRA